MKILLTNDDGVGAPGLAALYDALTDAHGDFGGPAGEPVWPCAPLTVQSATSHGVTFHEPLMVTEVRVNERMGGVAVDGRPADCVKLALSSLWPEAFGPGEAPDLVISGMNAGANVGINVIYSGTVAAALEAAFLGVPSIAVSLHLGAEPPDWRAAAARARRAIDACLATGAVTGHACLNINVPVTPEPGPMPPIAVCPMNTHGHVDAYERRISPQGEVYYWVASKGFEFRDSEAGADVDLLLRRCITVTPLWHDLTDTAALPRWRERLGG